MQGQIPELLLIANQRLVSFGQIGPSRGVKNGSCGWHFRHSPVEMAATDTMPPPLAAPPAAELTTTTHQRPGHGPRPLPRHLRRESVEYTLPEAQRLCPCCGGVQERFGADVSEQLDYQPASLFIREHIRCKYACRPCHEGVTLADKPPQPLDKGLPGPGLLAQVAVSKYTDHLPLHRLERIFSRHGVDRARSTMCGWMRDVADLVRPLVDTMMSLVLASRVVHTDATKRPFQDVTLVGKSASGQMWLDLGAAVWRRRPRKSSRRRKSSPGRRRNRPTPTPTRQAGATSARSASCFAERGAN